MACTFKVGNTTYNERGIEKYLTLESIYRKFNVRTITKDEAKKLIKTWLPNLDIENHVEFITNITQRQLNTQQDIFGEIRDGAIKLYGDTNQRFNREAVYHEVLHLILKFGADSKTRNRLFKYAKDKYGDLSEYELEHKLARELEEMDEIESVKSPLARILARIVSFLKSLIDPKYNELQKFYDKIRAGMFRDNIRIIPGDYLASFSFMEKYFKDINYHDFISLLNFVRAQYHIHDHLIRANAINYTRAEIERNIYQSIYNLKIMLDGKNDPNLDGVRQVVSAVLTPVRSTTKGDITVLNLLMKELFPSFKRVGFISTLGEEVTSEDDLSLAETITEGIRKETAESFYEDVSDKLTSSIKSLLNNIPAEEIDLRYVEGRDALEQWEYLSKIEFVPANWAYQKLLDIFSNEIDITKDDVEVADELRDRSVRAPDSKTRAVLSALANVFEKAHDKRNFMIHRGATINEKGDIVRIVGYTSENVMFAITPKTTVVNLRTGKPAISIGKTRLPSGVASSRLSYSDLSTAVVEQFLIENNITEENKTTPESEAALKKITAKLEAANESAGLLRSLYRDIRQAQLLHAYLNVFDYSLSSKVLEKLRENDLITEEVYNEVSDLLVKLPGLGSRKDVYEGMNNREINETILDNLAKASPEAMASYSVYLVSTASRLFNNNQKYFKNSAGELTIHSLSTVLENLKVDENTKNKKLINAVRDFAGRYLKEFSDILRTLNDTSPEANNNAKFARVIDPLSDTLEYHVYVKTKKYRDDGVDLSEKSFYELESMLAEGKLIAWRSNTLNLKYIYDNFLSDKLKEGNYERLSALYQYVEARNTVAELHNLFSSVVEKNYMMGVTSYRVTEEDGRKKTYAVHKYLKATGYGFNQHVIAAVKEALTNLIVDDSESNKRLLQRFLSTEYKKELEQGYNHVRKERIKEFIVGIGLGEYLKYNARLENVESLSSVIKGMLDDIAFRLYRTKDSYDIKVQDFLAAQSGRIREISKYISAINPNNRAATIISGDRNKQIYKYTTGSHAHRLLKGLKGTGEETLKKLNPVVQKNPLITLGILNGELLLHDSLKNEYSGKAVIFKNENKEKFTQRAFSMAFASVLDNLVTRDPNKLYYYYQFVYQPSDVSKIPTAPVRLLTEEEVVKSIRIYNEQLKDTFFEGKLAKFKEVASGSLMKMDVDNMTDAQIMEEFTKRIVKIADKEYDENKDAIAKNTMKESNANNMLNMLSENNNYGSITDNAAIKDSDSVKHLFRLYYINNYINSYFLTQLILGDLRHYGDSKSIVKRGSGPNGPIIRPRIGKQYSSERATYYVVKDIIKGEETEEGPKGGIKSFLERIFRDRPDRDSIVKEVLESYDSNEVNVADAQGIMSSKRTVDLHKGYGNSFRLSRVHKPMYFGPASYDYVDENGDKVSRHYTAYVKYSAVSISPELRAKYPELAKLDEWMIKNNVDEIVFESAVKNGKPAGKLPTLDDIIDGKHEFDVNKSIKIYNSSYGMQFNAASDPKKGNVAPSQLISFLNVERGDNYPKVLEVYTALAELMVLNAIDDVALMDNKSILEGSIATYLYRRILKTDDQEHLRSLLANGVSINVPFVLTKAILQAAASIGRKLFRVPIKGGKLVLQSAALVSRSRPLKYYRDSKTGRIVAEVVLPSGLLTNEQREAIKEGKSLYTFGDGFGIRIPTSEIHSAIVFKVVDTYDAVDTNVVIVPDEITAIAGSDFDVDALFVYMRNTDKDGRPLGYIKNEEGIYTLDSGAIKSDKESDPIKTLQNIIVDRIIEIISDPNNESRMFSSISKNLFMDPTRKIGDKPKSAAAVLEQFGKLENKDLDLSTVGDAYTSHNDVSSGEAMIAMVASFIKTYTALMHISEDGNLPSQKRRVKENVSGENITSRGSEFARKLTNPGNNLTVEYKGKLYRNAEHAYQTWKSGKFDEAAYNSNAFKPKGEYKVDTSKSYGIMVDILTNKLKQHPELVKGIDERGGIEYLNNSTHEGFGDRFWEGPNGGFMRALREAYTRVKGKDTGPTSILKVADLKIKYEDNREHSLSLTTESVEGDRVLSLLDSLLNLALDNENDQFLAKMNAGMYSVDMLATLISLGIPVRFITKLFIAPGIDEILSNYGINDNLKALSKELKDKVEDSTESSVLNIDNTAEAPMITENELNLLLSGQLNERDTNTVKYRIADFLLEVDKLYLSKIKKLRKVLVLNRSFPVLGKDLVRVSGAVESLFGKEAFRKLSVAYDELSDRLEDGEESDKVFNEILTRLDADLPLSALNGKKFFRSLPHIAVSLMHLAKVRDIFQDQVIKYKPTIVKYLTEYYGLNPTTDIYEFREELGDRFNLFLYTGILHYKNLNTYNSEIKDKVFKKHTRGVTAFLDDAARIINKVQKLDLKLAGEKVVLSGNTAVGTLKDVNLFLSYLVIDKDSFGVYKIGTHSSGTLKSDEYFAIRNSFRELRKYSYTIEDGKIKIHVNPETTEEFSNVQEILLDYLIANTAIGNSLSGFGMLIPPKIIAEKVSKAFDNTIGSQLERLDFLKSAMRQFLIGQAVRPDSNIPSVDRIFNTESIVTSRSNNRPEGTQFFTKSSGRIMEDGKYRYFDLLIKPDDNIVYNTYGTNVLYNEVQNTTDSPEISQDENVKSKDELANEIEQAIEDVPNNEKAEEVEKILIKKKYIPNFVKYGDTVYMLTYANKGNNTILFQRVGKVFSKSKRGTRVANISRETLSLVNYETTTEGGFFDSTVKTIPVLDVESRQLETPYNLDKLMEEGEAIYVASVNSPTRLDRKKVKLVEKIKDKGENDEEGGYNVYKIEEVPESKPEEFSAPVREKNNNEGEEEEGQFAGNLLDDLKQESENLVGVDTGKTDAMGRPFYIKYKDKTTGKEYWRLTYPLHPVVNNMRSRPYSEEKKTTFAEDEADRLWEGLSPDEKLSVPSVSSEPLTKQQFIDAVNKKSMQAAVRGTIAHMYIQKNLEKNAKARQQIENEIQKIINYSGVHNDTMKWVDKNWEFILDRHNIDHKNGKVLSEVTIKSDIWETASTVDLLVENPDGTYTIADFKFGKFFNIRMSNRIWKFGRRGRRVLYQTPKEQAKLEVMLRALMIKTEHDVQFKDLIVPWLPGENHLHYTDYDKHVDVESHLAMIKAFLEDEYNNSSDPDNTIYGKLLKLPHFDKLFDPKEYRAGYSSTNINQAKITGKSPTQRVQFLLDQLVREVQFNYNPRWGNSQVKRKSLERANELLEQILDIMPNVPDIRGFEKSISTLEMFSTSARDSKDPMIQLVSRLYDEALLKSRTHFHGIRSGYEERRDKLIKLYYQRTGKTFTPGKISYLRRIWTSIDPREFWEWAFMEEKLADGTVIRKHPVTEKDWEVQMKKFSYLKDAKGNLRHEYKDMMEYILDTYDYFFINSDTHTALANRVATYRYTGQNRGNVRDITNIELATSTPERGFSTKFVYKRGQWFPVVAKTEDEFGHMGVRWMDKKYRKEMWRRWFTWHNEAVFEQEFNEDEMIPMRYLGNPSLISSENYSLNVEEQFYKFTKYSLHKQYMDPVYAIGKALQYRIRNSSGGYNTKMMQNFDRWLELFLKKNINGLRQTSFSGGLFSREPGVQSLYGYDEEGKPSLERGGLFKSFNWVKFFNWANNSATGALMWLKPLQGTANGIFSYLYGLKEGLRSDLTKGRLGKKLGISDDVVNFTQGDMIRATKDFLDMQIDAAKGTLEQNKLYQLVKKLGYMPEESQFWSNIKLDKAIHRGLLQDESIMYIFHSLPEEALSMIILAAQLRSMKIKEVKDENGKVINSKYAGKSFWDMYEIKKVTNDLGYEHWDVVWKDDYVRGKINVSKDPNNPEYQEVKGLTTDEVRRMMFVYQWMYGNYRSDERVVFEYYIIGKILLSLKRYIPSLLRKMFMSKGEVLSYGQYYEIGKDKDGTPIYRWKANIMEGRWRTLLGLFARYTFGVKPSKYNSNTIGTKIKRLTNVEANEEYDWSNLSDYQKQVFIEMIATATYVGAMLAGFNFLFGDGGADDDKDRIIAKYYNRIMMNFSQEWNLYEPVKDVLVNGLPVSFRVWGSRLQAMTEMTWSLFMWGIEGEDAAFTRQGYLRGYKKFESTVPIIRSWVEVANLIANDNADALDYFTTRILK